MVPEAFQDNTVAADTTAQAAAAAPPDPDAGPVTDSAGATSTDDAGEAAAPPEAPPAPDVAPPVDTGNIETVAPDVVADVIAYLELAIASLRALEPKEG